MLTATQNIFIILNAFRRGVPAFQVWKEFRRLGARLTPRLSFWLSLCRQAHLIMVADCATITEDVPFRATSLAQRWLSWTTEAQIIHLLEAWQTCPRDPKDRATRKRLLNRLTSGLPPNSRERRDLTGLEALGVCANGGLSAWGRVALGLQPAPTPASAGAWRVENLQLVVPLPPDWPLLWELEGFLAPTAPGLYPLGAASLRQAVQRGAAEELIALLEKGCAAPLSPDLRAAILDQPVLNVRTGIVLEFSNPEELKRLRRSPVLREHFDHILSPRHVCIEAEKAPRLLELLERRGIHARRAAKEDLEEEHSSRRTYFRQPTVPLPKNEARPKQDLLAEHLRLQQAIDILYHAPGGVRPEPRRITPLLIEERGGQVYVSAYCHTRRANRTFRLDRIEIPGSEKPQIQGA